MKQVTRWKSNDGELHMTKSRALLADAKLKLVEKLREIAERDHQTMQQDRGLAAIVLRHEKRVTAAFAEYAEEVSAARLTADEVAED